MVNHLRTTLLNELPDPPVEHEEFIPASFGPAMLSPDQAAVHRAVFNGNYPRSYRNFIATTVATVCLQSKFKDEFDSIDPRVAIAPVSSGSMSPSVTITRHKGSSNLVTLGEFVPVMQSGTFSKTWLLTGMPENRVSVFDVRSNSSVTHDVTFTSSTSSLIDLGGFGVYARLIGETSVPGTLLAEVRASAPMYYNIAALAERLRVSSAGFLISKVKRQDLADKLREALFDSAHPDVVVAAAMLIYVHSLL